MVLLAGDTLRGWEGGQEDWSSYGRICDSGHIHVRRRVDKCSGLVPIAIRLLHYDTFFGKGIKFLKKILSQIPFFEERSQNFSASPNIIAQCKSRIASVGTSGAGVWSYRI